MIDIKQTRSFLKGDGWNRWDDLTPDQRLGLPPPPVQKPVPRQARRIGLPPGDQREPGDLSLKQAIAQRQSRRSFSNAPLRLEDLSFLLWATQGIRNRRGILRTVPSAGARHPFETYLLIFHATGLESGLYRYLPLDHQLVFLRAKHEDDQRMAAEACFGQTFAGQCAALFAWTAIPYRTEWRYSAVAPKLIALDAGHVCQNLYLAVEAIGAGTCGIAAYDQTRMDNLLGVDGRDEFTVYLAPVGNIADY